MSRRANVLRAVQSTPAWSPDTWKSKADAQAIEYSDAAALEAACARLRQLPPLVTSWEVERLKRLLGEAQQGKRFLVQGGDCAETLADCRSPVIADKLKILLQMSLVMVHEGKRPVIRVGRFAGQYAKPRSNPIESREGVVMPSYFGDMVNRADFTPRSSCNRGCHQIHLAWPNSISSAALRSEQRNI